MIFSQIIRNILRIMSIH